MTQHELDVIDAMITYGGSFASNLGKAFRHADHTNFIKLKTAFPELWERYEEMIK